VKISYFLLCDSGISMQISTVSDILLNSRLVRRGSGVKLKAGQVNGLLDWQGGEFLLGETTGTKDYN
jgi:hypothetical protein